ncbi:hypothetical protein AAFF_G00232570 [Aldrovandia affinis]|uniref:Uncharacterized protein n=1 Tax=Aldrovandia affinis TaxID=143900 RepID=A0AAD7RFA6_9TELE|nr:hypothetical protein AAFF_G00232570 [Aldrovandia affinis]
MQKGWDMTKLNQGNTGTLNSMKFSIEKEAFDDKEPDLVSEEKHQQEETEHLKELQEETPSSPARTAKVKFQPMTVNIDLSSVQNNDDAYDFNTDFK